MALYSWFLRKINVNKELSVKTAPENYIKNFTMWPTAKIKPKSDVIPLKISDINNNHSKNANVVAPTEIAQPIVNHAKN